MVLCLISKAQLQHIKSERLKAPQIQQSGTKYSREEIEESLNLAKTVLSTSIVTSVINDPSASVQNPHYWKDNLLEQKVLQTSIEQAIQYAELLNEEKMHEEAQKVLVDCLKESNRTFEKYLEGVASLTSPFVSRLFCHIVETRFLLLKGREKAEELRDDNGEEEIGWVASSPKVKDFLDKAQALLNHAMQVIRARNERQNEAKPSLEQREEQLFEGLNLFEGEEALARCLYNMGVLAMMKDSYCYDLVENFYLVLPTSADEVDEKLEEVLQAMSRSEGEIGEEALWEAYEIRRKFYGNSLTHTEVMRCVLPLARYYVRLANKQDRVIALLQPVIDQKLKESSEGDEWVAKCMNVVAEAKEQLEKYEEAEALRIKALKMLQRTLGPTHHTTVQALRSFSSSFSQRELYPDAEKLMKIVLKTWKEGLESGKDLVAELVDVLHDLATIQYEQKKVPEAEESFRLALQLADSGLGGHTRRKRFLEVNLPTLQNTFGWFLYSERKPNEALPLLQKGLEALERKDVILKRLIGKAKQQPSGSTTGGVPEHTEQAPTSNDILESLNAEREMNSRQILNNLHALTEIYTMQEKIAETEPFAKKGVEILDNLLVEGLAEEVELIEHLENYAHALQATQREEEAAPVWQRCFALRKKHKI